MKEQSMIRFPYALQWTIANAMAAFCDFGIGALISAVVWSLSAPSAPIFWWQLFIGGVLALSPDFDIVPSILKKIVYFFLIFVFKRFGIKIELKKPQGVVGDHHTTFFHRPILFIPTMLIVVELAAYYFRLDHFLAWEILTVLCVAYHYLHDTRWFGDGDINLIYPYGEDPENNIAHEEWLRRWISPSNRSVGEILVGLVTLCAALSIAGFYLWVPPIILISVVGLSIFWGIKSIFVYVKLRR